MINTIENDYIKAQVKTFGAELTSIVDKRTGKELLWQGDSEYWAGQAPVLFPIVGALKDGFYMYDGKKYEMNRHGFARRSEFEIYSMSVNKLVYLLRGNDETLEVYPFKFNLFISYELEVDSLEISYKVENTDDKEMYFSIGGHPAFNLDIEGGDTYLKFGEKGEYDSYKLDNDLGLVEEDKYTVLDNESELALNFDLFKYDTLIFDSKNINDVSMLDKKNTDELNLHFENFPYLGVWTPKGPFLCLEPWHGVADFKNTNHELKDKIGINKLAVNDTFKCSYKIKYEKK